MRALAMVSLVFALALVALPVPAQVPTEVPTALRIAVAPVDAPQEPGGRFTTTLTVEYCYHTAAALAREPTVVTLEVVERPEWANARVDPPELSFPLEPAAAQSACAEPANATLEVVLASNAPFDESGTLTIRAHASGNPPAAASTAEDSLLVTARGGVQDDGAARAGANATTPTGPGAQDTPFPPVVAVVGAVLGVAVAIAVPPRRK